MEFIDPLDEGGAEFVLFAKALAPGNGVAEEECEEASLDHEILRGCRTLAVNL